MNAVEKLQVLSEQFHRLAVESCIAVAACRSDESIAEPELAYLAGYWGALAVIAERLHDASQRVGQRTTTEESPPEPALFAETGN